MKFSMVLFALLAIGIPNILPVLADSSEFSVNIVGGSEAAQSCVSNNSCYEPNPLTVKPRTLVVWTNLDNTAHTVTSGVPSENKTGALFDSGEISPGGTYSFIFMNVGTFDYFCSIHPWMTGKVMVEEDTANHTPGSAEVPEFGQGALFVLVASLGFIVFAIKNNPVFGL